MLDVACLTTWMESHFRGPGADAFRLETQQVYEVASDGSDYRRRLDGATEPTWERKRAWFDTLDRERDEGRQQRHVRIVTRPITSYTAMECTWAYALNEEHGQRVRILDLGERALPAGTEAGYDWWLVTDGEGARHALAMRYSPDGAFVGAEELPHAAAQALQRSRDLLWGAAEEFTSWYARHPELHRPAVA